jgi:uncharacterized repeat protein (TIGR01451 family)
MKKTLLLTILALFGLFTTAYSQECGTAFTDNGGAAANYDNNSDYTVTITPANPGDKVTVTFTTFNVEATWDALYVFNGNSIAAPQIASANPAANVPGGLPGGFWGTIIPGPFTSTSADGCLTFRFRSDNTTVRAGWIANVTCAPQPSCSSPTGLTITTVTSNSVVLNWTQPLNPDLSTATSWEVLVLPCATPAPLDTTAGTPVSAAPHTVTNLDPATCYSIFIRAICSETSACPWVPFNAVTTTAAPPECGGNFYDAGGPTGTYAPNTNATNVICPSTSGEVVTVTFTAYNTETNFDALYVYSGNAVVPGNIIPSANAAANVPGGLAGGYWGTTIPGPFTSSAANGCLTFVFRSDNSIQNPGWAANITCAAPATCRVPTALSTTAITATSATLNWTQAINPDSSVASAWEVIILPAGSPAPTSTSIGATATAVSFTITELTPITCYTFYVRAVCSETDKSDWSLGSNFCTQIAPPVCGGQFIDNGGPTGFYLNSSNATYTICPTNPGEIVTVIFSSFDTEVNFDALYVFDGNSVSAPQIASANPAGNVPGGLTGGFWGTTIPGPFTSTSTDGCLTFLFRSDPSVNRAGWTASVACITAPDRIVLVAFVDGNSNGIKDADELTFPNGTFIYQQNSNGTDINGYSPNGQYALYDTNPANTYNFSYQLLPLYAPYYNSGTTTYSNISIPVGSGTQFLYFPIISTQRYNDVSITISPVTAPRLGQTYINRVTYKNTGTAAADGMITFAKPPQITIYTVSQTGITTDVSGFTYFFTNLLPNETRTFTVTMTVPLVPIVNVNQLLTDTVSISAPSDDIDSTNNSSTNSQIIVNSWDPNDKMESRGKTIPFNEFAEDDYFFYTIRFQNNGSANANDVRIEDVLNAQIDETSVLMVSASHNYTMKRIGNQLIWDFKNIFLAPSSISQSASSGFVQFKVRLNPGFQAGDIIPNNATIFFDTNPAIATNTFNSKFTVPLSNEAFDASSLVIYPNPAGTIVQIGLINTTEQLSKVAFYDILGKAVKTIGTVAADNLTIDVSDLAKGVYLVEILSGTNLKLTKKLIIQ